ncbi:hypothetical protein [Pseudoalteromonas sp. APC 3694]|uniref:hypothetical protein n=1 Tax=Pseudoalteromonas sp. APC 3694 TaxID=3035202 RepID=UPI0025B46C59|nr:hypothetical protein [Pseudoalteromonas sp. APC 3694]MDN3488754.1 hypothetical protein [Pseudoalteromonas sp. APC 3694]|tara:strand:- start:656 stop:946 length:291 start_codon:yes stop_codon:yes gene_type:complete
MTTENTACNCFTDYLDRVKNHLITQVKIPEGAKDVEFKWRDQTFSLSGGDRAPVNPRVEFEFRAPKKGGGHAKNLRKDYVSIYANYCCFCGRKYGK